MSEKKLGSSGARINVACPTRREDGITQYEYFNPKTKSLKVESCEDCSKSIVIRTNQENVEYKQQSAFP